MPRTCDLCDSPDRATIDELILAGRSLLSINKELGVSYGSLRGHVSHGHHLGVRATPAYVPVPVKSPHGPDMIAVFSEAESALFERVDEQYLAELSRTSRIPVAKLRRCHQGVPHAKGCAACDALEATEQRFASDPRRATKRAPSMSQVRKVSRHDVPSRRALARAAAADVLVAW